MILGIRELPTDVQTLVSKGWFAVVRQPGTVLGVFQTHAMAEGFVNRLYVYEVNIGGRVRPSLDIIPDSHN